jgi:predicted nucleic acid-binding protein
MRIVVDTNIVFSAILNTNSKIGTILLHPKSGHNFYSTYQLLNEVEVHRNKIKKLSGYTDEQLIRIVSLITNKIRFISPQLIHNNTFSYAESLTADVDIDDTEFVALTEHIKGKLWSGDKRLVKGLTSKNWNKFVTTEMLYNTLKNKI